MLFSIMAILAIVFLAGSFFLPKSYSVKRTTLMDAPDAIIYNNTANFNNFYQWNLWAKMEPSAKVKFSGTPLQPNHSYECKGTETGSSYIKISTLIPKRMVDMNFNFLNPLKVLRTPGLISYESEKD